MSDERNPMTTPNPGPIRSDSTPNPVPPVNPGTPSPSLAERVEAAINARSWWCTCTQAQWEDNGKQHIATCPHVTRPALIEAVRACEAEVGKSHRYAEGLDRQLVNALERADAVPGLLAQLAAAESQLSTLAAALGLPPGVPAERLLARVEEWRELIQAIVETFWAKHDWCQLCAGAPTHKPDCLVRRCLAALAAPKAEPVAGRVGDTAIDLIVRDVAELPDRTSPENWPEAMLVTTEELRTIIARHTPPEPATPAAGEAAPHPTDCCRGCKHPRHAHNHKSGHCTVHLGGAYTSPDNPRCCPCAAFVEPTPSQPPADAQQQPTPPLVRGLAPLNDPHLSQAQPSADAGEGKGLLARVFEAVKQGKPLAESLRNQTAPHAPALCAVCGKPITETGTWANGGPAHIGCYHRAAAEARPPADAGEGVRYYTHVDKFRDGTLFIRAEGKHGYLVTATFEDGPHPCFGVKECEASVRRNSWKRIPAQEAEALRAGATAGARQDATATPHPTLGVRCYADKDTLWRAKGDCVELLGPPSPRWRDSVCSLKVLEAAVRDRDLRRIGFATPDEELAAWRGDSATANGGGK